MGCPRGVPPSHTRLCCCSSEFAVRKLKAAGSHPGLFVLRRSPQDFDSYLLTVCAEVGSGATQTPPHPLHVAQNPARRGHCQQCGPPGPHGAQLPPSPQTRSGQDYKRCLIRRDEDGSFWLAGLARRFCSLQELLGTYGCCGLQAEGAHLRLDTCCPPLPRGDTAMGG